MSPSNYTIGLLLADGAQRKYLTHLLQALNYAFVHLNPSSLEKNVNLVITDKEMVTIYKNQLLGLKYKHHCPVLVLLSQEEDAEWCFKEGFDDVLRLPLSKEELGIRLRLWLKFTKQASLPTEKKSHLFQIMLDHSLLGTCLFNETRFFYVSEGLAKLFGYTPGELLRMSPLELVSKDYQDKFKNEIQQRLSQKYSQKEEVFSYPFKGQTKDGRAVYCELLGKIVIYKDVPTVWATLIDISKRIEVEKRLYQAKREWESIFQAISWPTIVLDTQFNILAANWATFELFKSREKKIIGQKCYKLFHDPTLKAPPAGCPVEKLLKTKNTKILQTEMNVLNRTFWVSCTPILDNQGKIEKIIHLATDITKQKQTEMALRQERNFIETLLNTLDVLVFVYDLEGRIVRLNKTAEKVTGYKFEEIKGHPFWDIFLPSEEKERIKNIFQALKEGKSPQSYECQLLTKNGTKRLIRWKDTVLLNEKVEYIIGAGFDVTEERKLEEKLKLQDRLSTVGQLAAGVAHDFNNILTGILGYAQLLQIRSDISEKAKQFIEKIIIQGDRAASLIRQILDFSRQSFSKKQSLDLSPFLKEMVKMLRRVVPENIEIELNITPGNYWVKADLTQLQQVVTNLVVNARDAIQDNGKITIELTHTYFSLEQPRPFPQMSPGKWIVLKIKDTGTGIPDHVLPHIFEPFFTTKEVGRGSGLGLSQVYGIVKQHNGFIDVETKVGEGTTFIIYFPPLKNKRILQENGNGIFSLQEKEEGEETILLVEDEEIVQNPIRLMLKSLGYKVITAKDGKEALLLYSKHRDEIKLIITDMIMPEMGGEELIRILKEQGYKGKIIIITGYPVKPEWVKLKLENVIAILLKPIKLDELTKLLKQVMKKD